QNLPGLGLLQDGGVRANNPLAIALRESGIIWPMAKRHDLLLSVGTGFSTSSPSDSTGFLIAFGRVLFPTVSGHDVFSLYGWKARVFGSSQLSPHSSTPDIFRLDQAIDGTLPALDDTCSLEIMSNMDFAVPVSL
ncbi:unnamed protein product, partial [Penicillium salamii]